MERIMGRTSLNMQTYSAAMERLTGLYRGDDRIVISFSAGKDSGACLELCIQAAEQEGRLPVEVLLCDEEIMYPGTYEYAERIAARPEVEFHWTLRRQPIINAFNREEPYWWVMDPLLAPEDWVRQPPDYAYDIQTNNIEAIITPESFPPPPGKDLYVVLGLRVQESPNRMMGLYSSGGWITKAHPKWGYRKARPIYDWSDADIWLGHAEFGWDYNKAYDTMLRLGVNRKALRIAPPTMKAAGIAQLQMAQKAWPQWFDKVCERCPGIRTAAQYGRLTVEPRRRLGETWSEAFQRECIDDAPDWISERSSRTRLYVMKRHRAHSTTPFPEVDQCPKCGGMASWEALAKVCFMGDPFSFHVPVPPVEPDYFRPGTGTWDGGKPTW
jgi:predicted phosphoadenosine phosphosulfate sulfurtransferase